MGLGIKGPLVVEVGLSPIGWPFDLYILDLCRRSYLGSITLRWAAHTADWVKASLVCIGLLILNKGP